VNGDSVTQNPSLGYAYVSRAASQGLRPARDTLEQLDKLLPVAARKRGLALARDLAKAASTSSQPAKASKPIETASAKAAPSPTSQAKIASTRSSTGQLAAAAKRERKSPASGSETSAAPAGAKLAASGSWRIQLGAFSQAGNARALYEKLSSNPALAGRQPLYVAAGAITRLQVGPFESRASADATCRKLAVPCFAVPPK
jgi:cell division septation protein DedD